MDEELIKQACLKALREYFDEALLKMADEDNLERAKEKFREMASMNRQQRRAKGKKR